MAIKEKITVVAPAGVTVVSLYDWAHTVLSQEDLALFLAAEQRHNAFIASKATSVDTENGEVIFADEAKKNEANPLQGDMDFLFFWYRYINDFGYTVDIATTTV